MKHHILTLSIIVILIAGGGIIASQMQACHNIKVTLPDSTIITAEVADSFAERNRGLSNRDHLAADKGMLFLFSSSDRYSFWMKDTRIPLDLIWIKDNRVVDLASLEPEQRNTIPQYTPREEATAVLELNQGQAALHGITVGQPITWETCES